MHHHHVQGHEVKVGDVFVSPLATNPSIIFASIIEDIWHYDEIYYGLGHDDERYRFFPDTTYTVLRNYPSTEQD
ncbi:hypothetical protein PBI_SHEAKEIRA_90 [Mycobacterium phage SheaKeira]|nr:hypothetical protein PBI_SHEAKEIRA_90 [Mycobacterium phage SheaKeira]